MGTVTIWVPELSFHTSWYLVLNLPLWGGVKPTRIVRSSLGFTGRPGSTAASARNGPPGPELLIAVAGWLPEFVIVNEASTRLPAGTEPRSRDEGETVNWLTGARPWLCRLTVAPAPLLPATLRELLKTPWPCGVIVTCTTNDCPGASTVPAGGKPVTRYGAVGAETDVIRCGTALPFVIVISRGTLMLAGTQLRNWPWSPTSANWTAGASA